MDDFKAVNAIYAEFFGNHKPARSAVQVARLPLDALFEIEAIVRSVGFEPMLAGSVASVLIGRSLA